MSSTIYEILSEGHSKGRAQQIVDIVTKDSSQMTELMRCFFDEDLRICQRASWPMTMLAEKAPELIYPYVEQMTLHLENAPHDAVIRNTFRAFQFLEFDEDIEGLVFEKAFEYLLDIKYPVGIRVFAMTTCTNIALKYPELKEELIPVIEEHMPHDTSGYRARAKRELKRLRK